MAIRSPEPPLLVPIADLLPKDTDQAAFEAQIKDLGKSWPHSGLCGCGRPPRGPPWRKGAGSAVVLVFRFPLARQAR